MLRRPSPLLLCLVFLAGCAQKGDFPSLKPRPVERLSTEEPVRPQPVVAADPALDARVADLLAQARRGDAAFEAELPTTRARVSEAGSSGSETWVVAQQALSRLEAARAPTATALGDLDRLALERAARPTNAAQYRALLDAVETAERIARSQSAVVDRLRAALS